MTDKRLYVERRQGTGDYAVRRAKSERASATAPTQAEAIQIARGINPGAAPHVERVRHTSKGQTGPVAEAIVRWHQNPRLTSRSSDFLK